MPPVHNDPPAAPETANKQYQIINTTKVMLTFTSSKSPDFAESSNCMSMSLLANGKSSVIFTFININKSLIPETVSHNYQTSSFKWHNSVIMQFILNKNQTIKQRKY